MTEVVGAGPVDAAWLGDLLLDPAGLPVGVAGVRIRRLLVDRTGQVVGVDRAAAPLTELLDQSMTSPVPERETGGGPCPTSGGSAPAEGAAARLLRALLTDLPEPPARTDAYRPTAEQHRTVTARDTRCCFPGCRGRAGRSELDHRTAFPLGPTSTANLHPLCKHHHRLKHDGWQPHRHPDGTTTWTSPRGQTRTTAPP